MISCSLNPIGKSLFPNKIAVTCTRAQAWDV